MINNENLRVEKLYIDNNILTKEINLKSNVILQLSFKEGVLIKDLIINSSNDNNSALILYLNGNKIENLVFNKKNKLNQNYNKNIEDKNITGCVNIFNSDFIIDQININGSNCEDGLNIVKSKGVIKNIKVIDAISDGIDFDYSNIIVKNSNFFNIKGDCVDLSFGNYKFDKTKIDGCGDKGISAGENSTLVLQNSEIYNSEIGIASKDNSRVNIDNLLIRNTKNCLSAYNKKSEFSGGYIEYKNIKCEESLKDKIVDSQSDIYNKDNAISN